MNIKEHERISEKLCKYLRNLTWIKLRELKINGQQAIKIKNGQPVRFYPKTIARLRHLVEKNVRTA